MKEISERKWRNGKNEAVKREKREEVKGNMKKTKENKNKENSIKKGDGGKKRNEKAMLM